MPVVVQPERVRALRDRRGHRRPELRVRSEEEALGFIDEVGFCFLFAAGGFAMPTLWEAICGEARPLPQQHNDPDLGRTWEWKDTLPGRKACFYGKLLRKTPTLVSLAYLPCFYTLSPNYGQVEDYLEEYRDGKLSVEAKWVYEALLRTSPQSTTRLRKEAGLPGKANAARFDRAITELQAGLKIVKVGISDANAWGYCYVYGLVLQEYPHLAAQARAMTSTEAEDVLCLKYLGAAVCVTPTEVSRLFGWEPWRMERLIERLAGAGRISANVRWPGKRDRWLVRTDDLAAIC